jgi:hypothetical protein
MPSGWNILHAGQVLSHIGLGLEIRGRHIRIAGLGLSVIAAKLSAENSTISQYSYRLFANIYKKSRRLCHRIWRLTQTLKAYQICLCPLTETVYSLLPALVG